MRATLSVTMAACDSRDRERSASTAL